jgi:2-polyprenyl-6-methoxyphenol hydroxylase-like FAD-dependent oxidoreductase
MTRALIVGGGIGGLTAALWLHRIGMDVTVDMYFCRAEEK